MDELQFFFSNDGARWKEGRITNIITVHPIGNMNMCNRILLQYVQQHERQPHVARGKNLGNHQNSLGFKLWAPRLAVSDFVAIHLKL